MDGKGWIDAPDWPDQDITVLVRTGAGETDEARLVENELMYPGEPPYWSGKKDTYELEEVVCWKLIS